MTDQHRATPEEWKNIKNFTSSFRTYSCILELRDRIQQLEAAQQQLRSKLRTGLLFKTETTYGEASDHARRLVRDANSIPVTVEESFELNGKNYTYKWQAEPAPSYQPLTLVEAVINAIAYEHSINPSWKCEARAAIREVASWLRSQGSLVSGNAAAFASLIDAESDR